MTQSATLIPPVQAQSVQGAHDRLGYPNISFEPDRSDAEKPEGKPVRAASQEELFPNAKHAWFSYYRTHRNQVVCAAVGLLVAAGFLIIGFWPTLLLAVFASAGVLYGRYKDGDRKTAAAVRGIIDRLD
ncbi:DUF2273 domain-containing protein [Raoultibacter massiliensis]|uniref:DUF2273 domain-containing protein n=1 Tax=Raoultibacter massiliensis TaxID=1852371 RepID=A0ABV1JB34_9ACTN|nr:DUF2273 domain-containing protein [Raoultibacter massiliensis]